MILNKQTLSPSTYSSLVMSQRVEIGLSKIIVFINKQLRSNIFCPNFIFHNYSREFDSFDVKGKQKYLKTDGVWVWIRVRHGNKILLK